MSRNAKTESAGNTLRFATSSCPDKEYTSVAADSIQQKSFDLLGVLYDVFLNHLNSSVSDSDCAESAVAGAAAGLVVETALYPIDTIKTRLQAVCGGVQIILKGLYSGLAGNLAGVIPASALFIGVYEPTKQKLLKIFPENFSAIAHLAAGVAGGAASSIVRVPTEVIKQRIQTGQFVSAPDAVRLIVAKEGFRGLYAGYGSFLLRDLPFDAIQFCIYEQLRIGYKLAGSTKQYTGICHCVNTILREEGSSAFFRGMGPRVLWIGIGGSIFFGVLEKTKQLLARKRPLEEN
ncbi:UNVERIFIED_CONTAM: putative S-adenosylmethionine carrier 2, chloroplastic [Sesamum radiatum]|uniref:S-adenosylmethionine carrier 2, chloroplastic n=1 Tax=Sesamum radiatum TaxID=300843 RepID=A0AAW2Q284_SESRA